jgi:hypothetical protein
LTVLCVEAGRPHTAHGSLAELLKNISGSVRICDPYYGTRTLSRLAELGGCDEVRFLTQTPDGKEKAFIDALVADFCKEHPQVAFRKASTPGIHDRYILSPDSLMILGHGLKDIGGKQSFVINMPVVLVRDIAGQLTTAFDRMWAPATPLS